MSTTGDGLREYSRGQEDGLIQEIAAQDAVDFRSEVIRKLIHLLSLAIPIAYYFIPRWLGLEIIIPLAVGFVIVDLSRYEVPIVSGLFYKFFGFLLRKREVDEKRHALNGATFMLLSGALCIAIFPKFIAINSFTVLILADAASAVFGKRFGRHKIFPNRGTPRSYEGSIAFVIAGVVAMALTPKIHYLFGEYLIGFVACLTGAAAEVLSFGIIDDNIAIPVTYALTMWALYVVFYPHLKVYFMG